MFREDYNLVSNSAKGKVIFLKNNPLGFFIASLFAGFFVGVGVILSFTIGSIFAQSTPFAKIAIGLSFPVALNLVVMAGSELFTGNNFIMTAGLLKKDVTFMETLKVWVICFFGNWLGGIILSFLFIGTGIVSGDLGKFFVEMTSLKVTLPANQLFFRGILCNILVCLAVWCSIKLKSESGKLIMFFWCLFAFATIGFEHSVANMTILTIGILNPANLDITFGGYLYNIFVVTMGNIVGGAFFVALPYYFIGKNT